MKLLSVFILLAAPIGANAQAVHKCVDGKGNTSYQSAPCSGDAKTEKAWAAPPEPTPTAYEIQQHAAQRQRQQSARTAQRSPQRPSAPVRTHVPVANDDDACQAAKAYRSQMFEAAGVRRSFELSRQLDDAVYRACK